MSKASRNEKIIRPHLTFALMMIENQKQPYSKRPFLHTFFDAGKKV